MILLLTLVLFIGWVSLDAIRSQASTADRELRILAEESDVGSELVASVINEIRSAQQYLLTPSPELRSEFNSSGDSAYAAQRRFGDLTSLTDDDRVTLNRIADRQAEIEVAYSTAHALADIGRPDAALAQARAAHEPADSLIAMVRALTNGQARLALQRADVMRQRSRHRSSF